MSGIRPHGAGGNNTRISKLRKARAGKPRPAAARRRPTDSPKDRRCGKCPNQPTESMKTNKPQIGRQLSITSILSKRACARLGRRPSRQNATLCFAAASPVLPDPAKNFLRNVLFTLWHESKEKVCLLCAADNPRSTNSIGLGRATIRGSPGACQYHQLSKSRLQVPEDL